jgi:trimeric autotransporter adhesin
MAYQPKSYRKFVATTATAAVVASALAPVASAASFTDVPASYQTEVDFIVSQGIASGISETKFGTDLSIKRADAAVMIARALKLDTASAPDAGFKDVPERAKGAVNALKAAGIINGKTETTFGSDEPMTRAEMAKVIALAFKLEAGNTTLPFSDVSKTFETYVKALYANNITQGVSATEFGSNKEIKRGDFAKFLYRAMNLQPAELKVVSVSAIGAKKLEVKFNKAVDDKVAKFEVKKGTINVNVASVTFSEDKKSATIELTSKLTKGDYTVGVTGLTTDKLTGTVTAEDERVEKVEILSTSAPLFDADSDTNKDDVKVGYKVINQYGEDITKTAPVTATASVGVASASAGTATVTGNFKEGDKLTLTLVHAESAKSATAQLTASAESRVSEITVKGLINADGKSLTESIDLSSDAFYLEVSAKDQYGNSVTSLTQLNNDVIINETNPNVVDVASAFSEVTINGEKKIVLKLNNPAGRSNAVVGDSVVTLISKYTGGNTQFKVSVAESTRSDVANMSQPDLVVAGEDALVPVEVTDKSGNVIKDVKVLNDSAKGVKVTVGSTTLTSPFVLKDGNTFIKVPAAQLTTDGPLPVVAITSTNKVSTLTLNVRKAAVPTVITGLKADWGTTFKASETKTVSVSDLVIEDQYGRVMKSADVSAWLAGDSQRGILIEEDETTGSTVSISDASGANTISTSNATVSIVAGATKGTEKVTLTLTDDNGNKIASSAKDVTLRVTDGTEFKSYVVDAIKPVYDEAGAGTTDSNDYDRVIKVYGVLNDGSKVLLTNGTDYSVTSTDLTINADVVDGKIDATGLSLNYGTDKTEKTIPVTVTINATGEQFTQDVVFSKVAPKATSVKVIDTNDVLDDALTELTATAGSDFNLASIATGLANGYNIVVTDQYGVSKLAAVNGNVSFGDGTATSAPTLTIVPVDSQITITNNGTASARVTGTSLADQEKFDLTINYGGVKVTVRVKAE